MHPLPHHYSVAASAGPAGTVRVTSAELRPLETDLPQQFGGTGDRWSPEALFVAAVVDCLALTFRGVARARKLAWTSFHCEADGVLDRADDELRFTELGLRVRLVATAGGSVDDLRRAVEKAERTCLVTNSLSTSVRLHCDVVVDEPAGVRAGP